MATVVEVTTNVPVVKDFTLKFTKGEAADLKAMIDAFYKSNYHSSYYTSYRDENSIYKAVTKVLNGKADPAVIKVAPAVF